MSARAASVERLSWMRYAMAVGQLIAQRLPVRRRADVVAATVEQSPARLVRADDDRGEDVGGDRFREILHDPRRVLDHVPERLRIDDEPLARHRPDLALQRSVIEVLRSGHLDREVDRVARSGEEFHRAGRRLDAPVAGAAVLLASDSSC
jgi:hypothetical protein